MSAEKWIQPAETHLPRSSMSRFYFEGRSWLFGRIQGNLKYLIFVFDGQIFKTDVLAKCTQDQWLPNFPRSATWHQTLGEDK